ncbi:MAG: ribonuclease III [Pseudomonadota bacterium]
MKDVSQLYKQLNYRFKDISLLNTALTHRSASSAHNERLEFLGDAVLGFIMSEILYKKFPLASEGQLSRLRSNLVKGKTLAVLGAELKLGDFLNLGSGELKSGGYRRESIIADAVEAIIGAIYLDSGIDSAKQCVTSWYGNQLECLDLQSAEKDPKTRLQELLQKYKHELPDYQVIATAGDAHNQVFHVTCYIKHIELRTEGRGHSRRKAEQKAAETALNHLEKSGLSL